jgi:drug/metabolite transporter superfamily protein YnfA
MPRTINRSPEERLRAGRRNFVCGALFETVGCIALLFVLRWPTNIIVVVIAAVMLGSYNIVFWRVLKKDAAKLSRGNASDLL